MSGHANGLASTPVVVDTNIVLDLFVFSDTASAPLQQALDTKTLQWIATTAMRDELERVLAYPQIVPRMAYYQTTAEAVLQRFDSYVQTVDAAPKATVTCKDADDQKFIDLAIAHRALLLSKDKAVLCMARRLQLQGARISTIVG
jgi:putative PIN family toxin of toxin-antitoxin system